MKMKTLCTLFVCFPFHGHLWICVCLILLSKPSSSLSLSFSRSLPSDQHKLLRLLLLSTTLSPSVPVPFGSTNPSFRGLHPHHFLGFPSFHTSLLPSFHTSLLPSFFMMLNLPWNQSNFISYSTSFLPSFPPDQHFCCCLRLCPLPLHGLNLCSFLSLKNARSSSQSSFTHSSSSSSSS